MIKSGIKTLLDVEKADEIYAKHKSEKSSNSQKNYRYTTNNSGGSYIKKNQFNTFRQRDASHAEISELEKKLLNR